MVIMVNILYMMGFSGILIMETGDSMWLRQIKKNADILHLLIHVIPLVNTNKPCNPLMLNQWFIIDPF